MAENEHFEGDERMAEVFFAFPHESGIVMRRGIEVGMTCSLTLVMHCIYIMPKYEEIEGDRVLDVIFYYLLLTRVIAAIPRPYFWYITRKKFIEAR